MLSKSPNLNSIKCDQSIDEPFTEAGKVINFCSSMLTAKGTKFLNGSIVQNAKIA